MAKETQKSVERCRGCGKPVEDATSHVLIERVGAKKSPRRTQAKEAWGRMHPGCFARMTGKPKDLLEVLEERESSLLTSTA